MTPILAAPVGFVDVPVIVLVISSLFTVVTVIVAGVIVGRQRAQKAAVDEQHRAVAELQASLATFIAVNDELRKTNDEQKAEHARERTKWQAELAAEREKRAKLEGRLDAVTSHLAAQIVAAVAAAVAAPPGAGPTQTITTTTTTPGVPS